MNSFLSKPKSRNWLIAYLAQKCARDALIPLVLKHCNDHYSNNNKRVLAKCHCEYTCTNCDVHELEPYHKSQNISCTYTKCDCKRKNRQPCPSKGSCGLIYDRIKAMHNSHDPKWWNTNSNQWSASAWEQMKCFIHTKGYKNERNIYEADTTAIVQICLNYKPLRTLFGVNGVDVLEKVLKIRNEICHAGTSQISEGDLKNYISHMNTCLKLNVFKDFESETNQQLGILLKLENDGKGITDAVVEDALVVMKVSERSYPAKINKLLQLPEVVERLAKTYDARLAEMKNMMLSQDSKLQEVLEELKKNATAQPVNKVSTDDSAKALKPKVKVEKRKLAPEEHVRPVVKKVKKEGKASNIHHGKEPEKISSARPIPQIKWMTSSYIDPITGFRCMPWPPWSPRRLPDIQHITARHTSDELRLYERIEPLS